MTASGRERPLRGDCPKLRERLNAFSIAGALAYIQVAKCVEGANMPMLRVPCVKCRKWIPTGLNVSRENLLDLTHTERVTECPNCEALQIWNLDDVDMSVFPPSKGN
jgi:hypothetical protein